VGGRPPFGVRRIGGWSTFVPVSGQPGYVGRPPFGVRRISCRWLGSTGDLPARAGRVWISDMMGWVGMAQGRIETGSGIGIGARVGMGQGR
jgi:hypothetical protein